MDLKQTLRMQYKKERAALTKEEREAADRAIFSHILGMTCYRDARTVMAYCTIGSEAGTQRIIVDALARGKTVLLPVTDPHTETMFAARITAANSLAPGGYGILEPKDARPYSGAIDLVFVPGLVFNAQGYRIGYGKGYYDKFFFTMHKPCVKVGLAYSCQLCKDKFGEKHDVRMDWVVTQQGGICCER